METKFASSGRSQPQDIERAGQAIISSDAFKLALNFFPEMVLILDKNRQTIYANQELLRLFDLKSLPNALGKRPGEIFKCIHACDEEGGCGTSEFCRDCNAVKVILIAQEGKADSQDCRITARRPSGELISLDLRVWAFPLTHQNEQFTFVVLRDIRDEKRRAALEKVFFHDLLNEITVLKGFTENIQEGIMTPNKDVIEKLYRTTQRIVNVTLEQRDLLAAENGEYRVSLDKIWIHSLLCEIGLFYEQTSLVMDRELIVNCPNTQSVIQSDYTLLWRILSNLAKNALEATGKDGIVTLGYKEENGKKVFFVNNPGTLTDEVRHQLFQRSFTTKGPGRGLGAYSVRLFAEQYLNGKVWFESEEGKGTTFFVAF